MLSSAAISLSLAKISRAQDRLIVPGQRIGHLTLGAEFDRSTQSLGPSSDTDTSMGRVISIWKSKGKAPELDVMAERNFKATRQVNAFYLRQIRVTSPFFRTSHGLSNGDNLVKLHRLFPKAQSIGFYQASVHDTALSNSNPSKGHRIEVYDDESRGIAFEVARESGQNDKSSRVIAIIVHRIGRGVTEEYMSFLPQLKPSP